MNFIICAVEKLCYNSIMEGINVAEAFGQETCVPGMARKHWKHILASVF
jgi:hypothetical protein